MSALGKLRDQIAVARSTNTFVVLTPDEAQAIVTEVATYVARSTLSGPPHEGDDEHA